MDGFSANVKKLRILLDLKRELVGVKLLKNQAEFDAYPVVNLINPLSYCVAVKSATFGHRIKFDKERSGCGGSTRALGFEKPTDSFLDGTDLLSLGLFRDQGASKRAALETSNILSNTYGVLVQPLHYFTESDQPDVILVVGKPRELMRALQGYAYHHGITKTISMSGNQGVCVEATVYPMIHNTINVSMFCSGTRYLAHWGDDEAIMGIPISLLGDVVDGLYHTVNAVETDHRKEEINQGLLSEELDPPEVVYGKTYYTEYEREKRERRKNEQER